MHIIITTVLILLANKASVFGKHKLGIRRNFDMGTEGEGEWD